MIVMGKFLNGVTGGICLLILICGWQEFRIEVDSELDAAAFTAHFSVQCIVPESVAFVPTLHYISTPQSPKALASTCQTTLHGGINGEDRVSSRCQWGPLNHLAIQHTTPAMKLAGLQCKDVTSTELQVRRDFNEDSIDVAITMPQHSMNEGDIIGTRPVTLFGTLGRIAATSLPDGQDYDHRLNGEIAFGGKTASTGGTTTTLRVSTNSSLATLSPTLHFAFISH